MTQAESYDVVLAASYAQATNWNRAQALAAKGGAFAHVAQTFESWIQKLWEQNGDGRALAGRLQARFAAELTVERHAFKALIPTPGLSQAICECARKGLGVPSFDAALMCAARRWIAACDSERDVSSEVLRSIVSNEAFVAEAEGVPRGATHNTKLDNGYELAGDTETRAEDVPHDTPSGGAPALTPPEWEFLQCVVEYASLLQEQSLIELGSALSFLADRADEVFPQKLKVWVLGGEPLSAQQQAFFQRIDALELHHDPQPQPEPLKRATVKDVRMAFPAGGYAQAGLLLQIIEECMETPGSIVISSAHPLDLYQRLAPALLARGISCSVQDQVAFAQTDFGRAFFAQRDARAPSVPWDKAALTDMLHFSAWGQSKQKVWEADRRLRANRLASQEEAFRFEETSRADAAQEGFDFAKLSRRLTAQGFSSSYVREQQAAWYALQDVMATARDFGIGAATCDLQDADERAKRITDDLLESARFNCTRVSWPAGHKALAGEGAQVRIMAQHKAAQLEAGSIQTLIVCDLTTESYPLRESRSAAAALLRRLGAGPRDSALARARRSFSALLNVPAQRLVMECCLNDANADPLYPCAMLEEFAAAYAQPATDPESRKLEERYRFPAALLVKRYERGEEDLVCDAWPHFADERVPEEELPPPNRGFTGTFKQAIAPVEQVDDTEDTSGLRTPRLSASQLESYLDCPYKWFVTHRLGATDIDEQAGPREIGSFFHEVFQVFYREFGKKVTADNLEEARTLMFGDAAMREHPACLADLVAPANTANPQVHDVPARKANSPAFGVSSGAQCLFDRVVQAQYDAARSPYSSRLALIPHTSEERELDYLRDRVDKWLKFETTFLPGFTPIAFECVIPRVEYEGCLIKGVIDRIDVDEAGRAVIIDYKGSLLPEYRALGNDGFNDTGKIQALMYAKILQQAKAVAVYPAASDKVVVSGGSISAASVNSPTSYVVAGDYEAMPDARIVKVSRVVGALYVSYNKDNKVSGALDATVIGAADVPTLQNAKSCSLTAEGELSFAAAQEHAAARVREAVSGMCQGQVSPCPSSDSACKYCPVATCEMRCGNAGY